jgi:hypothetical protein
VRSTTAPSRTIRLTGLLDTTPYGGLDGFVAALRTVPRTAPSALLRVGNGLAVNVMGAGLAAPGQTMVFPPCRAVIACGGTAGEFIGFLRQRATNIFRVTLLASGKTFKLPVSSAPLTVTLSLGGFDDLDQANCTARGTRHRAANCRP